MLPQVLAGLGFVSVISAGCLLWLQRLQPLFFALAVTGLVYELWLVGRRPDVLRKLKIKVILALSLMLNVVLIAGWILISVRYR